MLQLENHTPFKAAIAVLPDCKAIDTLYVIIKATVTLRPFALAEIQVPPTMADEYYANPATSSLRCVSDMHIGKPGTDVLLIGHAQAPDARPVQRMMVSMSVAERKRTIQVSGDRVWHEGQPTAPRPFVTMPLVWERAFGGFHRTAERILAEERNPAGCGFSRERSAEQMQGQPVPNLEDPTAPLQELGADPTPACFAPISPAWLPRRAFAGTYDARWQRTRAPYLPSDFDPRFLQCAGAEFAFKRFLQGGEPVEIRGVTPDAPIAFSVPLSHLDVEVSVAGAKERPPVNLETLTIEPEENRACFTWRASVPCDRKVLKVETIVINRGVAGARA